MGKILNMPTYLNAYSFKSGTNIPINAADIVVVNDTTLDVSNIDIAADVKTFFGAGSTSLGVLCQLPAINKFARYRPEGVAPFRLGDFAGYNHYALPPSSIVGMTSSTNKTYESSTGLYPFNVHLTIQKGEREPSIGVEAWGAAVVKFTYNTVVIWSPIDINATGYASATFKSNTSNAETVIVNVQTYYTNNVTSATVGAVALTGYGDGHFWGKLIEDPNDNKNYSVDLAAVSSTLTCEFTASLAWDSSKNWVSVGSVTPSGYNYVYNEWTAQNGTIVNIYANYIAVTLTTVGGIIRSGDFSVNITASQSGMISVSHVIPISIRNNVVAIGSQE